MLWIPRAHYDSIVAGGLKKVKTPGSKGFTYYLPMDLQSNTGLRSESRHIRIAMAIVGTTHVLVVVDHNMEASRLHLGKHTRNMTPEDLLPDSKV